MEGNTDKIAFNCKRCGKCCGPHFVSPKERLTIRDYLKQHDMEERPHTSIYEYCPYLENNTCLIYPVRPLICRLMGITELLPCPEGCEPAELLPKEVALRLIDNLVRCQLKTSGIDVA